MTHGKRARRHPTIDTGGHRARGGLRVAGGRRDRPASLAWGAGHHRVPDLRRARRVRQGMAGGEETGGDQGDPPGEGREGRRPRRGGPLLRRRRLPADRHPRADRRARGDLPRHPARRGAHPLDRGPVQRRPSGRQPHGAGGAGPGPGHRLPGRGRGHRRAAGLLLRTAPARDERLQARGAARHHRGEGDQAQGHGALRRPAAPAGLLHRAGRPPRRPARRRRGGHGPQADPARPAHRRRRGHDPHLHTGALPHLHRSPGRRERGGRAARAQRGGRGYRGTPAGRPPPRGTSHRLPGGRRRGRPGPVGTFAVVRRTAVVRTARKIFDGTVFPRSAGTAPIPAQRPGGHHDSAAR